MSALKEFLEKTKGKKIRWHAWSKEEWCVPTGDIVNETIGHFVALEASGVTSSIRTMQGGLGEGVGTWSFVEDEIMPSAPCKCGDRGWKKKELFTSSYDVCSQCGKERRKE